MNEMLDERDFAIYNGVLDISRVPKKELTARYKSLVTQLMVLSNTNTKMCVWLMENKAEVWEELINHDFNADEFPSQQPRDITAKEAGEEE
jgi:hypothetical protein